MGALLLPRNGPAVETINSTVSIANGTWYRIAIIGDGVNNNQAGRKAAAEFILSDDVANRHGFIRFRASVAYNSLDSTLYLQEYTAYNNAPVSLARIVTLNGTAGGWAIELYSTTSVPGPMRLTVKHEDWLGASRWTPVDFQAVPATPTSPQAVLIQRGFAPIGHWRTPQMNNGWVNYDPVYNPATYRMLPGSMVEIRGLIKNGGIGTNVFLLGQGWWPLFNQIRIVMTYNNVAGRVDIGGNGSVVPITGSSTWVSLDGIQWLAEQ